MAVMLGRACKIVGSLRSQVTAKQLLYEVRHIVGLIWQSLNNKAILSAEVVSSILQSLQKKDYSKCGRSWVRSSNCCRKISYRVRRSFDLSTNSCIKTISCPVSRGFYLPVAAKQKPITSAINHGFNLPIAAAQMSYRVRWWFIRFPNRCSWKTISSAEYHGLNGPTIIVALSKKTAYPTSR